MIQYAIPTPPPITDGMTDGAPVTGSWDLIGKVITAYDIPDSDRRETLLLYEHGRVILISCDPGYTDDGRRIDDQWDVCFYDASDTEAGQAIKKLHPGQWL